MLEDKFTESRVGCEVSLKRLEVVLLGVVGVRLTVNRGGWFGSKPDGVLGLLDGDCRLLKRVLAGSGGTTGCGTGCGMS